MNRHGISNFGISGNGGWIERKGVMKRPYCRRVYSTRSPRMKMLETLYLLPGRALREYDLVQSSAEMMNHLRALASDQLVTTFVEERKEKEEEYGGGGHEENNQQQRQRYCAITIPGVAHYIASRLGLSFAYTVYLAYLYIESRDPMYAFTLAGGDAELAKRMAEGKVEYPYGILYSQRADKKFEGANMFVLGTFVKDKGYCLNGLVPEIARHELSRKGIVRCAPGGTLMIPHEKYKELQKYDADMRDIVAWADKVCEAEAAGRMSEAAAIMLAGESIVSSNSNDNDNNVKSCESA